MTLPDSESVVLNIAAGSYFVALGLGLQEWIAIIVGISIVVVNVFKIAESNAKRRREDAETRESEMRQEDIHDARRQRDPDDGLDQDDAPRRQQRDPEEE